MKNIFFALSIYRQKGCIFGLAILAGVGCLIATGDAAAEGGKPDQFGSIELRDEEVKVDPYKSGQESSIAFFQKFSEGLSTLADGKTLSLPELDDAAINYLSGVYLYCSGRAGLCPFILDAILEADILRSRQSGQTSCPTMKRFWNKWVGNDMENRHKYMVGIGQINEVSKFNSETRPRYLRCEETIHSIADVKVSNGEFYKERFKENSDPRNAVKATSDYLIQIKEKVQNVFVATGMQSGAPLIQKMERASSPNTRKAR